MNLKLMCLVWPDDNPHDHIFPVKIDDDETIGDLKKLVKNEHAHRLHNVDASDLILWKCSIPADDNLQETLKTVHFDVTQGHFGHKLPPVSKISEHFSTASLLPKTIHILIQAEYHLLSNTSLTKPPAAVEAPDDHRDKRLHVLTEPPHTPPAREKIGTAEMKDSPPRLSPVDAITAMEVAIKPFDKYIDDLAKGELDGYFGSIQHQGKEPDLDFGLPPGPILLLDGLGGELSQKDQERVNDLFSPGITHLFAVSGAGKTRLSLEGLCQNWGIYLSCRAKLGGPSGSGDIQEASRVFATMSTTKKLVEPSSSADQEKNINAARRAFSQLLCARIFVLEKLLQKMPSNTTAAVARRRWVLVQILPPWYTQFDIFVTVLKVIRGGDTNVLDQIASDILQGLKERKPSLFPSAKNLFVVVDEAQVAAQGEKGLEYYFRSGDGANPRPILREIIKSLDESGTFSGVILSGTGLSLGIVNTALSSVSAKNIGKHEVFVDTGCFGKEDPSHQSYINRYLKLSGNDSDRRLLERMQYWLSGRYRFTASVIELLLSEESVPRHRVLTEFIEKTTGFTLTDAKDLEDKEPPLSKELMKKIRKYGPITSAGALFEQNNGGIIQQLCRIVLRWMVGSHLTFAIDHKMHEAIALGVGSLMNPTNKNVLGPNANYPVYINEPLVVLDLRRQFEIHDETTRRTWIASTFSDTLNSSSRGYIFEQVVLFSLVEIFGGKGARLDKLFECNQPWGSRKVKLVSLIPTLDGNLQACDVSWTTGSSDRLGFQANKPQDVLNFLHNPGGKTFIFPDTHMGPDLLCFLQDQETGEIIVLAVQCKVAPKLNTETWLSAVQSLDPKNFYTVLKNEAGEQDSYAKKLYPTIGTDIEKAFEEILGDKIYAPVLNAYHEKLRGHQKASQQSNPPSRRKTPRFLRVIATPDTELAGRLEAEWKGDMAVLRWSQVKGYLGIVAGSATMNAQSVS